MFLKQTAAEKERESVSRARSISAAMPSPSVSWYHSHSNSHCIPCMFTVWTCSSHCPYFENQYGILLFGIERWGTLEIGRVLLGNNHANVVYHGCQGSESGSREQRWLTFCSANFLKVPINPKLLFCLNKYTCNSE